MTRKSRYRVWGALVLLPLIVACSTITAAPMPREVSEAMARQLDHTANWDGGSSDDQAAVRERVAQLLGAPLTAERAVAIALRKNRDRLTEANVVVILAADVKQTYYTLLADRQSMNLYRDSMELAEAAAELTERQFAAGTASAREQAMRQWRMALTALDVRRAETHYVVGRESLNHLLGLQGADTQWELPLELPEPPAALPERDGAAPHAVVFRLDAAHAIVERYHKEILPLADRVVAETLLLYNGMLVDVYALLEAKQDQIGAQRDFVAATRDFWHAWVDLERALGGALPHTPIGAEPDGSGTGRSGAHQGGPER